MKKEQDMGEDNPAGGADVAAGYPPVRYAFFVIFILMIVTFQAQLDRQLPSLLVSELRAAFDVTDTQISFFQGAAFAVLYTIMAPVFGILVDRKSRRNLIIFGVLFWSGMTIWSGFAQDFWELLISRMGVGFGEAVLAPAAYSLISDYVEPRIRGRALAIYMISMSAGTGSSLIVGGFVMGAVAGSPTVHVPYLGDVEPWRFAFLAVGTPGLLAALLMLLVREAARREDGSIGYAASADATPRQFVRHLRAHWQAFTLLIIAQVSASFVGYALLPWLVAFYQRKYDLPAYTTGPILGVILISTGVAGLILSGVMSDYWTRSKKGAARLRPLLISQMVTIPALMTWPLVSDLTLSFVLVGVVLMQYAVALGTFPSSLQEVVPNRMRGQIVTVGVLISTLLGSGLAPTVTALYSDNVFSGDNALGYALVAASVPAALISVVCAWLGMKPYAKLRREIHGGA